MDKLNVYIVEDEPVLATLLKYTLRSLGHEVCGVAESFTDAVRGLRDVNPDLIITDIMLKGQENGIDLAKYINANKLNIPFIFQSSIFDDMMIKDAMSTQPLSYIRKPVSKQSINDAIAGMQR